LAACLLVAAAVGVAPAGTAQASLPLAPQARAAPDDCRSALAYPGDTAPAQAIALWMAHGARARGIPGELPVMGGLVESGLKNLNYGDADAVGFFAMRKAIWDNGEYAGFPDHPELQLKWFVDQSLTVRERALASGNLAFGLDPNGWGSWVADVERPAEQFRGRYQLRLEEARQLIGPECAGFAQPVAVNDRYATGQEIPLLVAAPGVLANDSGFGTLSASLVSVPAHGTLAMTPDGGFEYRGASGFAGTDSFTYRTTDWALSSDPATVTITVAPPPPSNAFRIRQHVTLKKGSTVLVVLVPGPGTITAGQAASSARAGAAARRLVRTTRVTVRKAGAAKLSIRPSRAGASLLRRKRALAVRLRITFKPAGGTARTTFKRVRIKRGRG
jgi:hypothetical protein